MKIYLIIFILICSHIARSDPFSSLAQSPRALLMGNAFTSIADDEFTLFYNPAALGLHSGFTITPVNLMVTGTNVLGDTERFKNFPDDPVDIADRVMNYPVHLGLGATPGFKMDRFAVSYAVRNDININLLNPTHPVLDVDYNYDRALVMGYAHPIGGSRISGRNWSGSATHIGFNFKYVKKEGMKQRFDLTGTQILDAIETNEDDFKDTLRSLGLTSDSSLGYDIGLLHSIKSGPHLINAGLTIMDIADTNFGGELRGERLRDHPMNVNLGLSYQFKTMFLDYGASIDLQQLNMPEVDFRRKLRFGGYLGLPMARVYAGFSEGYYSYGLEVDLLLVRLMGGFYSVEVGNNYKQQRSSRAFIYLNLLEFSFDV